MKLKAVSGIMLTMLLIGLFAGLQMITSVSGHAPGISLSAFTTKTPTIDGVINLDEWQDAAVISTTKWGYEVTFFVMNDLTNLYLAVRVSDFLKGTPEDTLWVIFDNDHDNIFEVGDDTLYVSEREDHWGKGFSDCHRAPSFGRDEDVGGTNDGSGATVSTNGFREYEVSHPLNSADDLHDFSLNAGDTVGFYLEIEDLEAGIGGKCIDWPAYALDGAFTGPLGDITIALPPPVGGKAIPIIKPINKPELLTPWIWLTTIILSLVLTVVYVKKRKRHTQIIS